MLVAKDGSGDFKSIQEALNSIPERNTERIVSINR
jgi:pectin methylesterase-like acyl-CoA thioesterase